MRLFLSLIFFGMLWLKDWRESEFHFPFYRLSIIETHWFSVLNHVAGFKSILNNHIDNSKSVFRQFSGFCAATHKDQCIRCGFTISGKMHSIRYWFRIVSVKRKPQRMQRYYYLVNLYRYNVVYILIVQCTHKHAHTTDLLINWMSPWQ